MKKGNVADGLVFHAGFPNAGEDQTGHGMSLDAQVFRHRLSTFLWRLEEDMPELGWQAGSVVVVDRALNARQNNLVVAIVEESFVVRKLHQNHLYDVSGKLDEAEDISVWGVVTHVLQEYRSP
jgi:DNA polymerase V